MAGRLGGRGGGAGGGCPDRRLQLAGGALEDRRDAAAQELARAGSGLRLDA